MNSLVVKIILGLVSIGNFSIAFGQEQIAQFIPFVSSNSTECLKQFYRDEPPFLVNENLQKNSYPLCFNGFNVMYSGVSKTPLWSAEHLSPERLSQKIKREDSFHEETRVSLSHRALLSDYKESGYDRGHMSNHSDMSDKVSQYDSFSLANIVPQAPKNNREIWRELEEATQAIVTKQKKDVYVVTGPVFSGKKLKTIGKGVIVPSAVFKAIYIPKQGVIGAYYAPNDNSLKVNIVSVCYLEERLGINLFPQLTEEQKRNTYKLPLNSSQVKATGKVEYSHRDAESQCAPSISPDQIKKLQKQFQPESKKVQSESHSPNIDEQEQISWIKKLFDSLVQYVLQILK